MLGAPEGGGLFSLSDARRPSELRGGVDDIGCGGAPGVLVVAEFVSMRSRGRGGEDISMLCFDVSPSREPLE